MRARGSQPEHGQRPAAAEAAALVGATEAPPVDAEAEIRSVAGLLALCLGDVAGEDQQEKGEEGVHKTMAGVFRLSDEHWARIEPLLPVYVNIHRFGGGRPRVSDRKVMDAIFFVLRTGAQWRALDVTGICHGATAHRRFQQWREAGVFKALWEQGLLDYDGEVGIEWEWLSVDGSMGKAPLGGSKTGRNPTDRGKLGHKRSVMCEALGIPVGLATEGANRNDCKLSAETIDSCPVKRPEPSTERPQNICLDKAYDNAFIREELRERGLTPHIRSRGEEVRELDREAGEKARRWVVERIFSWLNRYRGLLVRWSKKPENHDALLHFAMALITWQQLDLRALAPLPP